MDRTDVDWHGYWAALPTPFTADGDIDRPALAAVTRHYLDTGVQGLLINGSTGEWFSQSPDERAEVVRLVVEECDVDIPLIAGCTDLTISAVRSHIVAAAGNGATGVMVAPPPYLRPSPDEIHCFFSEVCRGLGTPVMIYNIPRRVGIGMRPELLYRLATISAVVALKNSVPEEDFWAAADAVGADLRIFGQPAMATREQLTARTQAADGYIGGQQLLGAELPGYFAAIDAGDLDAADRIARRERQLDSQLWDEHKSPRFGRSFQSQMKAALNLMGVRAGYPREPLLPVTDPESLEQLRHVLEEFGLIPSHVQIA